MRDLQAIFWDFDGVLMDSNAIRDHGFEVVLSEYPTEEVQQLMEFHKANGGLSRYVKFRYFFEQIRRESISDEQVNVWAARFSDVVGNLLLNDQLLIPETNAFVRKHSTKIPMFVVSGSDQTELRGVCKAHGIDAYFVSIHGSPTPKKEWVDLLLNAHSYNRRQCLLIGDSFNDFEAAQANHIQFMAYNNPALTGHSTMHIDLSQA